MTRHEDDPIASGRAALARLNKDETFADWIEVGRALDAGRLLSNSRTAYSVWLVDQGFSSVDKGVRSRLLKIIAELPAVLAWRETLSGADRLKYNHPNSIWRKYKGPPAATGKKNRATQSSPLPLDEREKLATILGMLGNDNEIAASQALDLLAKHNVTWFEVLGVPK